MLTAQKILDKEFLETRCQLIEIAATLDRIDRAAQESGIDYQDARLDQIRASLQLLLEAQDASRAEQLLLLFSDIIPLSKTQAR